ncbi:MAG: Rpn family recombination-promoting nuclease/putative transposase [Bacteroidales bacterium]|nr:Rpn family recombination-promoting nuclease/putative transposase [Bacteroidales bacterium]
MSKFIDAPHSKTRYADIRRDKIFQLVFAAKENEGLLIKLMNHLLPSMHISRITLVNKDKHGQSSDDRHCIFDVYCVTESGEHVLIEMQYNVQEDFRDRTLYYSTYPIREQIVTRLREAKAKKKKLKLKYLPRIKYRLDAVHIVGIINSA